MTATEYPKIAVVADAHFHDINGEYGLTASSVDLPQKPFRRLAETAKSTRVFNESHAALHYTLEDIAKRGIRHVVLLGDYSDDGQRATLIGLREILDDYATTHGIRFYAIPGNHDIFGAKGRHRTKRFLNSLGSYDVATSNPTLVDPEARRVVCSNANYCDGYPEALQMLPDIGIFGGPDNLYWETPFGTSADPAERTFPIKAKDGVEFPPLMDASYLVEPSTGIWLMMIDANVFKPHSRAERVHHDEDHADSGAAGWNAVLTEKPFILNWMKDVAARAKKLNKRLLTFSHYPVLDPIDGTYEDERALLGQTSMSQRIPHQPVADAILETDTKVHFSGHVHVNDTARYRRDQDFVVNVSVPSLVAFPAGYKIVEPRPDSLKIETVEIGAIPQNAEIESQYLKEVAQTGLKADRLLGCADYGTFLFEHLGHLVSRRFLRREWPEDLAAVIGVLTLADFAALAVVGRAVATDEVLTDPALLRSQRLSSDVIEFENSTNLRDGDLTELSALSFLEDLYRLRMGSDIALDRIHPDRLAAYDALANLYAKQVPNDAPGLVGRIAPLFLIFTKCRDGLPSRDFKIDLQTGDIHEIQAGDQCRPKL
ncbi:MAG: metallophosphoesterase family protein [Boseongicola sp.]